MIALTDDDHLAQIHHTARLAETATSPHIVIDHVCRQLVGLLRLSGCRFEYGTLVGRPPRLEEEGTIAWDHRRWNADREGLPREELELRVFHNGRFHGRFMLRPAPGAAPPLAARLVAVTLANLVGAELGTAGHAHARRHGAAGRADVPAAGQPALLTPSHNSLDADRKRRRPEALQICHRPAIATTSSVTESSTTRAPPAMNARSGPKRSRPWTTTFRGSAGS
ncbi:hypothetical protein NRF20_41970 [Streptomyces sp. R-74717]